MITKEMIKDGDICIIWQSPEITSGPFTARANLPEDLKTDMRQAILDIVEKDPVAFKEMTGGADSTQKDWIEVDHSRYEWIVEMRDWLKKERRGG